MRAAEFITRIQSSSFQTRAQSARRVSTPGIGGGCPATKMLFTQHFY